MFIDKKMNQDCGRFVAQIDLCTREGYDGVHLLSRWVLLGPTREGYDGAHLLGRWVLLGPSLNRPSKLQPFRIDKLLLCLIEEKKKKKWGWGGEEISRKQLLFNYSLQNSKDWVIFCLFSLCRLDLGAGKEIDLTECPRSILQERRVKYLGPVCNFINQI